MGFVAFREGLWDVRLNWGGMKDGLSLLEYDEFLLNTLLLGCIFTSEWIASCYRSSDAFPDNIFIYKTTV